MSGYYNPVHTTPSPPPRKRPRRRTRGSVSEAGAAERNNALCSIPSSKHTIARLLGPRFRHKGVQTLPLGSHFRPQGVLTPPLGPRFRPQGVLTPPP
eukprot:754981-Prorocentrum_minimum.AAC.3